MAEKTGVAIFGSNGHQINRQLADHPRAKCVAVADFPKDKLPDVIQQDSSVVYCSNLDELLSIDDVELVCLCSAMRSEQGGHAIKCLEAGKNVYAEKPCAFSEEELDEILATARRCGKRFHDMAGTALEQPWKTMREICASGKIGEIIQVFAQKSYPYHDKRPQDENVDGGLLMQVGVHAARFIEHIACVKIKDVQAFETQKGNPVPGQLRMACSVNMQLECGGIATLIANYYNSSDFGTWGNEEVRVLVLKVLWRELKGAEKRIYILTIRIAVRLKSLTHQLTILMLSLMI